MVDKAGPYHESRVDKDYERQKHEGLRNVIDYVYSKAGKDGSIPVQELMTISRRLYNLPFDEVLSSLREMYGPNTPITPGMLLSDMRQYDVQSMGSLSTDRGRISL